MSQMSFTGHSFVDPIHRVPAPASNDKKSPEPARGKKCDAVEGILDEGTEIMDEYKGEPALDAGLLAAAQAVEHYEI